MSGVKSRSPVLRSLALALGLSLSAIGLFGVIVYVAGVVDIIVNQPADRSWLFWGLGLAGIALTLLAGGVTLLVLWTKLRPDE